MKVTTLFLFAAGCAANAPDDDYDHDRERAVLGGKADGEPAPRKRWTLLHYGAADNNLADAIFEDVNELERIGSSADVHVVAMLDHATLGASRIYVEHDDDPTALGSAQLRLGEVDSGDPQTLIDFAAWAIESFPADHYAVVIGGHGGLAPRVIAPDDKTGNSMSLSELWAAMRAVHALSGKRVGVFGGDACLIQTVETAVELDYEVDYVVASELTEPGPGWAYEVILGELTARPEMPAIDLAGEIVDSYRAQYPDQPVTLTAIDTARVAAVEASLSRLSLALRADPAAEAVLHEVTDRVFRPDSADLYVDARDLAERLMVRDELSDEVWWAADDVAYDVEGMVVARAINGDALGQARGVSLFWPRFGDVGQATLDGYREALFADGQWDELVAWYQRL